MTVVFFSFHCFGTDGVIRDAAGRAAAGRNWQPVKPVTCSWHTRYRKSRRWTQFSRKWKRIFLRSASDENKWALQFIRLVHILSGPVVRSQSILSMSLCSSGGCGCWLAVGCCCWLLDVRWVGIITLNWVERMGSDCGDRRHRWLSPTHRIVVERVECMQNRWPSSR